MKLLKYLNENGDDRHVAIHRVIHYLWCPESDGISDHRVELVENAVDTLTKHGYTYTMLRNAPSLVAEAMSWIDIAHAEFENRLVAYKVHMLRKRIWVRYNTEYETIKMSITEISKKFNVSVEYVKSVVGLTYADII